jgi:predicted amino acid-binding ACT domain protein
VSQITPTGTTCNQFVAGTADTLSSLQYSVKDGVISQVSPGVFFYWVRVTAVAGINTFTINQTITTGNFATLFAIQSGSNVFDTNCNSLHPTITQSGAKITVQFYAPTAGTYIISVKFSASSVKGAPAPAPTTTVHYQFSTANVPDSTSGLDLVKGPAL